MSIRFDDQQQARFRERPARDAFFWDWRTETAYVRDRERTRFREWIPDGARSILEIGCGDAPHAELITRDFPGLRYVGIDRARKRVAWANQRFPEHHFAYGDALHLPVGSGSFDVVFCNGLFHHLEPGDYERVVGEMLRVAAPGGRIFFQEPNGRNPFFWLLGLVRRAERGIWDSVAPRYRRSLEAQSGCQAVGVSHQVAFLPFVVLTQLLYGVPFVRGERAARWLWRIEAWIEGCLPESRRGAVMGNATKA